MKKHNFKMLNNMSDHNISKRLRKKQKDKKKQTVSNDNSEINKQKILKHEIIKNNTLQMSAKFETDIELHNIDLDKVDEVLVNVKKKELNDTYKSEDVEDILFSENTPLQSSSKSLLSETSGSANVNNKLMTNRNHSKKNLIHFITNQNHTTISYEHTETNCDHSTKKDVNKLPPKRTDRGIKHNLSNKEESNSLLCDKISPRKDDTIICRINKNNTNNVSKKRTVFERKQAMTLNKRPLNREIDVYRETKQEELKEFPRASKLDSSSEQQSSRTPLRVNSNKLREKMMLRFKAAQFRFMNEKLYTSPGEKSQQLFHEDPAAFTTYHQGYQHQLKKWPVKPIDLVIKRIKKMPKSHVIVDMGCGEAALSQRVPHTVRSFDLVSAAPGVEVCDIAHTPLLAASVDAVVYCLALMGTDLTQYLLEANRVLKRGGCLLIAEVASRFEHPQIFARDVQRLGFKLNKLDLTNKMFIFLEFKKIGNSPVNKNKLPKLILKPCLYKKR